VARAGRNGTACGVRVWRGRVQRVPEPRDRAARGQVHDIVRKLSLWCYVLNYVDDLADAAARSRGRGTHDLDRRPPVRRSRRAASAATDAAFIGSGFASPVWLPDSAGPRPPSTSTVGYSPAVLNNGRGRLRVPAGAVRSRSVGDQARVSRLSRHVASCWRRPHHGRRRLAHLVVPVAIAVPWSSSPRAWRAMNVQHPCGRHLRRSGHVPLHAGFSPRTVASRCWARRRGPAMPSPYP